MNNNEESIFYTIFVKIQQKLSLSRKMKRSVFSLLVRYSWFRLAYTHVSWLWICGCWLSIWPTFNINSVNGKNSWYDSEGEDPQSLFFTIKKIEASLFLNIVDDVSSSRLEAEKKWQINRKWNMFSIACAKDNSYLVWYQ